MAKVFRSAGRGVHGSPPRPICETKPDNGPYSLHIENFDAQSLIQSFKSLVDERDYLRALDPGSELWPFEILSRGESA
jgi:hypothetical protein